MSEPIERGPYEWRTPDGERVAISAEVVEALAMVERAFPEAEARWWRRGKADTWKQITQIRRTA